MTLEEKRAAINSYCANTACAECKLSWKWIRRNGEQCLPISDASEAESDWALELINEGIGDAVNHPSHYNQGKFECIDVMVETFGKEATKNFCLLNSFKYIWRTGEKNGAEDVKKAIWYLNKFLELEGEEA